MNFATAFLKYLAKTHFDTRCQSFELFLEIPKGLKARKHVTSRIMTKKDAENVLLTIRQAYKGGGINTHHYLNYRPIVLFGAFTGQRPQTTVARLSVGQFRNAWVRKSQFSIFCQIKTRYACSTAVRSTPRSLRL